MNRYKILEKEEEEERSGNETQKTYDETEDEENRMRIVGKIDLKILLLNARITVVKVEEMTSKFMKNKKYISFFCFTETKVDQIDFIPVGLKIYIKRRKKNEKRGGGLAKGI